MAPGQFGIVSLRRPSPAFTLTSVVAASKHGSSALELAGALLARATAWPARMLTVQEKGDDLLLVDTLCRARRHGETWPPVCRSLPRLLPCRAVVAIRIRIRIQSVCNQNQNQNIIGTHRIESVCTLSKCKIINTWRRQRHRHDAGAGAAVSAGQYCFAPHLTN